ncbi:aldo/keto reductase [Protaetiibacter mangrovi]|uniref:Aldo/keto reductase n=1 Tax=Protaetiibacter mangrovi TaxID=2970926 RepID=A0ABT1ZF06_9MICO|nr:aldo/keto reductase [Protaetiibacter mangrovi]MCS0499293.1 aldo/keto reductase [Protaetiibacter mangrovi]TPX05170.1 aldo/keto reductase [Schumannella luteola]
MQTRTTQHGASPVAPVPTTLETAAIVGRATPLRREIPSTGIEVFPLAISGKRFGSHVSDAAVGEILDAYTALGGNMIDTADSYSEGRSEQLVGEWMRRRGNRDAMVLATKVGKSTAHPGLSASAIPAAVDASLRRLGTDRIDLLYLHVDDTDVPFEETLLAVDELIRRGKVRTFGMSDHTGTRLLAARVACALLGVAPMSALQNEYSLVNRSGYEGDLARVAAQQGLAVMPRFPLAGGFLTGAYRTRAQLASTPAAAYIAPHLSRRGKRVLTALEKVAREHDGAAPATIALGWLLSKPEVVAPVVSVSSADQLFDVMASCEVRFSRHQLAELDRASA